MTGVEATLLAVLVAFSVRDLLIIRILRKRSRERQRLRNVYEHLGVRWPPEETNRRIMDLLEREWR